MTVVIDYTIWIGGCAIFFFVICLLNIKRSWMRKLLVILSIFLMCLPRLFPTTEQDILSYEKSERNIADAKILDDNTLYCFSDKNYSLDNSLNLETGFYDRVEIFVVKSLKIHLNRDIIIKIQMTDLKKYLYVS